MLGVRVADEKNSEKSNMADERQREGVREPDCQALAVVRDNKSVVSIR